MAFENMCPMTAIFSRHQCVNLLRTHTYVGNLTIIVSDNSLSPWRRQASIWTNGSILLIGPLGKNFIGILIEIHIFLFKQMYLKMSIAKWCLFCLGLNVLIWGPLTSLKMNGRMQGGWPAPGSVSHSLTSHTRCAPVTRDSTVIAAAVGSDIVGLAEEWMFTNDFIAR